jgi:glutathione S-transferase
MELYQAEWCPHSHRVRQRLTELGADIVLHQVPAEPDERSGLATATGQREIPALVTDDGKAVCGDDDILAYLHANFSDRADAKRHRAKARQEVPQFEEVAHAR